MNKVYYTDRNVRAWCHSIIRNMAADIWKPDYIVGLTRGGLVPANLISQYLDVPMEALKVSLRDSKTGPESNLWMAEDAFNGKKILIVDDINDSGETLNWIKKDWESSCYPYDSRWDTVWGNDVRVAVLINNEASEFKEISYVGKSINKIDQPEWCVFPWENWWE